MTDKEKSFYSSKEKDLFTIDFQRVYQDQPDLIESCCNVCLDLSIPLMFKCRECKTFFCQDCQNLSSIADSVCFYCSQRESIRPVSKRLTETICSAIFSCKHFESGCPEKMIPEDLKTHEIICPCSKRATRQKFVNLKFSPLLKRDIKISKSSQGDKEGKSKKKENFQSKSQETPKVQLEIKKNISKQYKSQETPKEQTEIKKAHSKRKA